MRTLLRPEAAGMTSVPAEGGQLDRTRASRRRWRSRFRTRAPILPPEPLHSPSVLPRPSVPLRCSRRMHHSARSKQKLLSRHLRQCSARAAIRRNPSVLALARRSRCRRTRHQHLADRTPRRRSPSASARRRPRHPLRLRLRPPSLLRLPRTGARKSPSASLRRLLLRSRHSALRKKAARRSLSVLAMHRRLRPLRRFRRPKLRLRSSGEERHRRQSNRTSPSASRLAVAPSNPRRSLQRHPRPPARLRSP